MTTPAAPELRRSMGLLQATAMVVGTIIGASIFVQPSEITSRVPSVAGILLVWVASGVLTLFGALVCAELASAFPESGGVYVFLKRAFSPTLGFLWGWAMFWSMHSGIIAAIAVVFARYVAYFVPLNDTGIRLAAIAAVVALSAVNYAGVRQGGRLQALFTIGKVGAIAVMIVAGFVFGSGGTGHVADGGRDWWTIGPGDYALALIAGLFTFGGWHMVTYSAEETLNPRRTIPVALMIGVAIVTLCYIALNAAYLYVLPLDRVATSTRIAADAASALVGPSGAAAMSALVIFSTFGALNGIVLTGPRVYFAMARDGLTFQWLAAVHPRYGTPHRAIIVQAIWSSVLVATGTYRQLFTRVIYTEWIFFALMAIGIFVLRRRPGYAPDYRTWGYPVTPALFAASSFVIVINQIASDPAESAIGLLLVLAGLPVHALWLRTARRGDLVDEDYRLS